MYCKGEKGVPGILVRMEYPTPEGYVELQAFSKKEAMQRISQCEIGELETEELKIIMGDTSTKSTQSTKTKVGRRKST
jgi:hypothetical protein